MFRWSLSGFLLALWLTPAAYAQGTVVEITFESALAIARASSPEARRRVARSRLASSQIDAASVRPFNPQLSAALGPRFSGGEVNLDWSVQVRQWLETGGQRGDRENVARAEAATVDARSDDSLRLTERDVSLAFFSALYWQQRVELSQENQRVARAILRTAERRHELGDVGGLDVSVATLAAARSQAEEESARVASLRVRGALKALLGVSEEIRVSGDLRELGMAPPEGSERAPQVAERADLRVIRSRLQEALAAGELGRASRWPNVALGAQYTREAQGSGVDGAHIVQGTLSLSLPIFDHGQGAVAVAAAQEELARMDLEVVTARASVEAHTAARAAGALSMAARHFEETGLPALERAERQAIESYEAGALPLGELLAIRRELLQTRAAYLDQLLEAAAAQAELRAQHGAR